MKARPILFSGPMVRALLAGTKTQTRRAVKPQPPAEVQDAGVISSNNPEANGTWLWLDHIDLDCASQVGADFRCPYGVPGDLLYVRETWKPHSIYAAVKPRDIPRSKVFYGADDAYAPSNTPWVPGIHQPRWASRLTLEITDIRIERLLSCSEADAGAEGIQRIGEEYGVPGLWRRPEGPHSAAAAYFDLWDHINGKGAARANPWVWAVSFAVHHRNVDAVMAEGSGS